MTAISFGKDDFPFLTMKDDLMPGKSMLGQDDLVDEGENLIALCALAGGEGMQNILGADGFNPDDLLMIEADADGILQRVYSPAIWFYEPQSQEDTTEPTLVLRVGSNLFPVQVKDSELICGSLKADGLEIETVKNAKDEHYLVGTAVFSNASDDTLMIVEVRFDGKSRPTTTKNECIVLKKEISAALKKGGKELGAYLMKIGQGGGSTVGMHELGSGQFLVEAITELELLDEQGNPRRTFTLQLANGASVWAKGNVATILNDRQRRWENSLLTRQLATKSAGTQEKVVSVLHLKCPVTLTVGKIEQKGNGFMVSCKLTEKAPDMLNPSPSAVAMLEPSKDKEQEAALEAIPF